MPETAKLLHLTLEERRERFLASTSGTRPRVTVCAGTGCMANGSMRIYERFREVLAARGIRAAVALESEDGDYQMVETGCQGFCQMGPLVSLRPQGIMYVKVRPADVEEIVDTSIVGGGHVERLLYTLPDTGEPVRDMARIPFYERQHRLMLALCGNIDVHDLDEYVFHGGYFQARRAACEMTDTGICGEILASGLKGRGGGGFPTGRKWELTRVNAADAKYIVCNGDEGDPGAFMDRCVMEGNPHAVIEGMMIAAMGVNATYGYVYVRMEYPLAVKRLKYAIAAAREAGILGGDVFGSGKSFDVEVKEGAGAFVCGEETALMASIEGRRGMPSLKPPYPAEAGLFGKPTVINNVETLATVPIVLRMGAAKYAEMGTADARGTKTFALTGHVANTGLIEVPFGTTLREIVADIGGGVTNDDGTLCGCDFKAVQIGGPSGGCLTREHLDLPLDYVSLQGVGAMVGSGGLVVMNRGTCMVQISRFFMQFTQNESCGKCVVCREGTRQMLAFLDDIIEGRGTLDTLALLEDLARAVKVGSLCGLGKTAPNPVLSSLRYFREEYLAHVVRKRCPAGACTALLTFRIIPEKCRSCSVCARNCPAEAISGKKGVPYTIDPEKCVKCGVCEQKCKFNAVVKG
ncbi:MAG: NAD(P)H-dependent oxidoreductase subunit E [Deltaproteobacteria bacterium]|jgi:NADH-quinone oxidoreductase subunit F|nr:NAD(P)H-dependent oxidoreductase subunit E [Deltaproteobacteria bacterium]